MNAFNYEFVSFAKHLLWFFLFCSLSFLFLNTGCIEENGFFMKKSVQFLSLGHFWSCFFKLLLQAFENKRLFILDYHDTFLPFMERMNSLPGRKAYASRTVFLYTRTGFLRPIAIELSLPPTPPSPKNTRVYTHGHDNTTHWIWKLAKAHVCSNDAGVHQLVNHWWDCLF